MADIEGSPVTSTAVYVDRHGIVQYLINGAPASRDDFNAITLTRIARAVETLAEDAEDDEGEGGEGDEGEGEEATPSPNNLFGI